MDNRVRIAAVALASLAVGAALGGFVAHSRSATGESDPSRQRNDLVTGYGLLWSTLEDESQIYKLGLLKKLTFDAPPEKILGIIEQVSEAANNTLEELGRYRELPPRIDRLPVADSFGTDLQAAMKEDTRDLLLKRSPDFSKRLIISQAQALRMVIVLSQQIARSDPNEERREWLERVASDYTRMYDAYLTNLAFTGSD